LALLALLPDADVSLTSLSLLWDAAMMTLSSCQRCFEAPRHSSQSLLIGFVTQVKQCKDRDDWSDIKKSEKRCVSTLSFLWQSRRVLTSHCRLSCFSHSSRLMKT